MLLAQLQKLCSFARRSPLRFNPGVHAQAKDIWEVSLRRCMAQRENLYMKGIMQQWHQSGSIGTGPDRILSDADIPDIVCVGC